MKNLTFLTLLLLCTYSSFGQTITGNVSDATDAPLRGNHYCWRDY